MLGRFTVKRSAKQEGESPFWISFSDLMTALMTLFLIVMAVTLIRVVVPLEGEKQRREDEIKEIMNQIIEVSKDENVTVNANDHSIDLGRIVNFKNNDDSISPEGAIFLRRYIPKILNALGSRPGQEWTRRIFVEGFTSQSGTYLHNLDLSLFRSRNVVCALFDPPGVNETAISDADLDKIQKIFLVGGYSNSSIKPDPAESRRVELKIEFWGLNDRREQPQVALEKSSVREQQCVHLQRH
jgi:OmpA family/Membrane MotB of proton-channel complex MotA/MotB